MKKVALIYDFDKTLITTNMQEKSFVEALGLTVEEYWSIANSFKECDGILAGVLAPVIIAKEKGVKFDKKFLQKHGAKLDNFFEGVEDWFKRIVEFGLKNGIEVEHYIVSSGYYEMIASSKIAKYIKKIFGCRYLYDKNGDVLWPSVVINYTQKTQYLARIQKNLIDDIYDDKLVNMKMKSKDIHIPYSRMIYFGDGDTDVPSMKMLGANGGHSICVYTKDSIENAKRLLKDKRVDFALFADYSENGEIDKKVKELLLSMK